LTVGAGISKIDSVAGTRISELADAGSNTAGAPVLSGAMEVSGTIQAQEPKESVKVKDITKTKE
jgi:hypothetical protein